jgi:hypothetical protein
MKFVLVILLGLLAPFAAGAGQNLLQNPSFEEKGEQNDLARYWNRWGQWINRETGWVPTHNGSCLLGYHHWQIEDSQNSGVWQDIAQVKAGQRFKFSACVMADKPDKGAPFQKLELRLEATRDGRQVTIASVTYTADELPAGNTWHEISVTGTTPENNLRVLIVLTPASQGPRGGAVKIDDAALELLPAEI